MLTRAASSSRASLQRITGIRPHQDAYPHREATRAQTTTLSTRPFSSCERRANQTSAALRVPGPKRPSPKELLTVLQQTIETHGPLPISRYMTLCLAHPTLGYYTTRKVFGSQGDFITSPEISQIFGELLALWFIIEWAAQGSAAKVRVVELGPGKGTLLADILRTFKSLPPTSAPPITSVHLVESSDALREAQRAKLAETGFEAVPTHWWNGIDEVPPSEDEFTIVIAHEFFDALPIHIFENTPKGWREVMVDIADPKNILVGAKAKEPLRLVLAPNPTPASTLYTHLSSATAPKSNLSTSLSFDTTLPLPSASTPPPADLPRNLSRPAHLSKQPVGSRMEISPASWEVARGFAKLLTDGRKGGAGLVVDYGDDKAFGRSWRGFRKHEVVDPLSQPGHTDLTANVDFAYMAEAMSDLVDVHGPLPQGTFLESLGLRPRLEGLLKSAKNDERRKEMESAANRLVDKTGMGVQYKVMAITPKGMEGVPRRESFPFITKI